MSVNKHPRCQHYYRKILHFSIPILLQTLMIPLGISINTAIIGHFVGTEALAGLGIGAVIMDTLTGIVMFMTYSTNSKVANNVGKKDDKALANTIINSLALGGFLGIAITIIGFVFASPMSNFFVATIGVKAQATWYMHGVLVGVPFLIIDMTSTGILRGIMKYKIPTVASIFGLCTNISLAIIFVTQLNLGIFGTGLATGCAVILESLIKTFFVVKHLNMLNKKLELKEKPSINNMFDGLVDSTPLFLRSLSLWMAALFTMYFIGILGTEAMAGVQIVDSIWIFIVFILDANGQAIISMIAEKIGANKFEDAKLIVRAAVRLNFYFCAALVPIILVGSIFFPHLFTPDRNLDIFIMAGLIETCFAIFHTSYAYTIDGALMAAHDYRYLAIQCITSVSAFVITGHFTSILMPHNVWGFITVWATYDFVLMGGRAIFSKYRMNKDRWLQDVNNHKIT